MDAQLHASSPRAGDGVPKDDRVVSPGRVRYPRLWAIGTMLEPSTRPLRTTATAVVHDPIADFYFFNPVGILMYSFDQKVDFSRRQFRSSSGLVSLR